jgi:hypothetical protein
VIDRTLGAAFIDNNVCHRIFGRRLFPFSCWHRLLLLAVDSPFLKGGEIKLFDIREAIGICSLRYPNCKITRPWIMPMVAILLTGLFRKRWIKFLTKARDRLLIYFGDYISRPEYSLWYPDPSYSGPQIAPPPRLGPIPESFSMVADMIGFLHCSVEEAWNMPIGQAYWWQMAAFKHAGENINFLDESEREFQAQMRVKQEKTG